jgi:hypothetical protein
MTIALDDNGSNPLWHSLVIPVSQEDHQHFERALSEHAPKLRFYYSLAQVHGLEIPFIFVGKNRHAMKNPDNSDAVLFRCQNHWLGLVRNADDALSFATAQEAAEFIGSWAVGGPSIGTA